MTDQQKFKCLTIKYRDIYRDYESFAKRAGIGRATVHNWEQNTGKGGIHAAKKSKISTMFGLEYEIWTDNFYTEHAFYQKLDSYRLEDNHIVDDIVIGSITEMNKAEKKAIRVLVSQNPIPIPGNLQRYSYEFMFALVVELKKNNQSLDALHVLSVLLEDEQFSYTYYGKLHHMRAVLLSHRDVQQWDEALKELRFLYKVVKYHLKEREVITLMASNLKRKALYHPSGMFNHPDQIDFDMLGNALSLYAESYKFKEPDQRYYDAINMAYLIAILNSVGEDDGAEEEGMNVKEQIKALYDDLIPRVNGKKDWKVDTSDWWQAATKMEFLVLMGRADDAAKVYDDHRLEYTPESFDLDATTRQLEAYTYFVKDSEAETFLEFLRGEVEEAL